MPYLYGMFLHCYLRVPVGIINVARGGTTGQTWCLREELEPIEHVTVRSVLEDYDAQTAAGENPDKIADLMSSGRTPRKQPGKNMRRKLPSEKLKERKNHA